MSQELTELKQAADKVYAEWQKTKSQGAMNRWLEINDRMMVLIGKALGAR